ncbi:hypothetical protein EDB87DRAFT_1012592 [Lactarius vividus]|nr:hypothetical protein EDB87DRAFT_1012592 [Lactarius vividus]
MCSKRCAYRIRRAVRYTYLPVALPLIVASRPSCDNKKNSRVFEGVTPGPGGFRRGLVMLCVHCCYGIINIRRRYRVYQFAAVLVGHNGS